MHFKLITVKKVFQNHFKNTVKNYVLKISSNISIRSSNLRVYSTLLTPDTWDWAKKLQTLHKFSWIRKNVMYFLKKSCPLEADFSHFQFWSHSSWSSADLSIWSPLSFQLDFKFGHTQDDHQLTHAITHNNQTFLLYISDLYAFDRCWLSRGYCAIGSLCVYFWMIRTMHQV